MQLSERGKALLIRHEGYELKAYKADPSEKYYTIGYGHYGADVKCGMKITKAQAEDYLTQDLKAFEDGVNSAVKVPLKQNQFDALVIFSYNVGIGAFKKSTLLKLVNKGDFDGAAEQFLIWNKVGGKFNQGLMNRRLRTRQLFLIGNYGD